MGIPGRIIGELGELGKKVGGEVVKAPKDIAGTALESLGTTSPKAGQTMPSTGNAKDSRDGEQRPWQQIDEAKDQKAKQVVARAALAAIAGKKPPPQEPSVWERSQQEEAQKKEKAAMQVQAAAQSVLPVVPAKRPPGDLYGMARRKSGTETSRNVRQD